MRMNRTDKTPANPFDPDFDAIDANHEKFDVKAVETKIRADYKDGDADALFAVLKRLPLKSKEPITEAEYVRRLRLILDTDFEYFETITALEPAPLNDRIKTVQDFKKPLASLHNIMVDIKSSYQHRKPSFLFKEIELAHIEDDGDEAYEEATKRINALEDQLDEFLSIIDTHLSSLEERKKAKHKTPYIPSGEMLMAMTYRLYKAMTGKEPRFKNVLHDEKDDGEFVEKPDGDFLQLYHELLKMEDCKNCIPLKDRTITGKLQPKQRQETQEKMERLLKQFDEKAWAVSATALFGETGDILTKDETNETIKIVLSYIQNKHKKQREAMSMDTISTSDVKTKT
jgi:hypothetical protein